MRPSMHPDDGPALDMRVLLVAPTRRDAEVTCAMLEKAGIAGEVFNDVPRLAEAVASGVGAIMLTDAALAAPGMGELFAALDEQPPWSDVPVILLTPDRQHSRATAHALEAFTNVTLVERPASARSMLSAVMAALRARRRQYEMRDQMAELRLAEQALREADQRKDEFLATLAHELRNPLAPIRTGLELLERVPGDGPQAVRVRAMMQRQVNLLIKLIDDLLDVSRIATGKVMLHREVVDLRGVVEAALEGSEPMIGAGGHRLHVHLPAAPVGVMADPMRMAQVIGNLVNNAAKYTARGGEIAVSLAVEGDEAVVRVSDNGVGIPADMLEQVFHMFAQVDRTLDQSQGGLGIGLSLARRLVALHGGSVVAESAGRGQGSTFTVRLPVIPIGDRAVEPPKAGAARVRSHPRVLVVDDNVDAADTLAVVLGLEGCETRVEYGALDALRTAGEFRPRAVVCDIGLPGLDGCEIARRLRADPVHAGTLLVALTGLGSEEDKRRTREAGFDLHLVKPVDLAAVQDMLARL
jgi:signal transduction histidine kinase